MSNLSDIMARVRIAGITGNITPDLARLVLTELQQRSQPSERHALRNNLLREAGAQVSGSAYAKAHRLQAEIRSLESGRCAVGSDPDGVRALVRQALETDPATPRGWRQLLRILEG